MRKFDRLPSFDERSKAYPITFLLPRQATSPRSYTWACQPHLDQGPDGACVGFGWAHELAARPVEVAAVTYQIAMDVYHEAQKVDEWPGEDYEGSSVLAGAKVVQKAGFMDEYRWAFGLQDVLLTLSYHGPVVLGVNWRDSMMQPPDSGIVEVGDSVAGGHCILANGISVKRKLVRLHQSWGLEWGVFGDCFVTWDGLAKLLDEEGEACVPVRRDKVGKLP